MRGYDRRYHLRPEWAYYDTWSPSDYRDAIPLRGRLHFDTIALSGGAQNGAWQAGVLLAYWHVMGQVGVSHEQLVARHARWVGTSVGAVNAGAMAQGWPPDQLAELWLRTRTQDVVQHWWGWYAQGYFRGGAYDASPLTALLDEHVDPARFVAECWAGTVNLESGAHEALDVKGPDSSLVITASSVHPVAMAPIYVRGAWRTDGGVRHATPLRTARALGGHRVLVVSTTPEGALPKWAPAGRCPTIVERTLRELEIAIHEAHSNDAGDCRSGETLVAPLIPLESEFLQFTRAQARRLITTGLRDGLRALQGILRS